MNKDTKLYQVVKFMYLSGNKRVSSQEISKATGISIRQITPYTNALKNRIGKIRINGKNYFWLKEHEKIYIRKLIVEAEGEDEIPVE